MFYFFSTPFFQSVVYSTREWRILKVIMNRLDSKQWLLSFPTQFYNLMFVTKVSGKDDIDSKQLWERWHTTLSANYLLQCNRSFEVAWWIVLPRRHTQMFANRYFLNEWQCPIHIRVERGNRLPLPTCYIAFLPKLNAFFCIRFCDLPTSVHETETFTHQKIHRLCAIHPIAPRCIFFFFAFCLSKRESFLSVQQRNSTEAEYIMRFCHGYSWKKRKAFGHILFEAKYDPCICFLGMIDWR